MRLSSLALFALLLAIPTSAVVSVLPASAASFDCAAASTPFENAICDFPELSSADELLAKTYATATGGLTKVGVTSLRADQKSWLDYAQRACTEDAEPLVAGSYDETASACLVELFKSRSTALENSRMIRGHRFYVLGRYDAKPDPYEVDVVDSNWKVGTQEVVHSMLDEDDPLAGDFNSYVLDRVAGLSEVASDAGSEAFDGSSNSSVLVTVKEVAGTNRITLGADTFWYGHGAAHGNYSISYLHYYVPEAREMVAGDVFAGDDWGSVLADAAWEQLQIEHKDWLQVEGAADIAESVADPTSWDLSNDYGLVIQFQPYQVAAYAYGAPTITIPWEKLDAIKAETQDEVRFGF